MKSLVVIAGPTAVGKTELTVRLAKHFNTEVISADSRQFFKEMLIGTARPLVSELQDVPHHFLGFRSIEDEFSTGMFEREALLKLEELFENKDLVIVTGGSGLYIRALCQGLDEIPEVNPMVRADLVRKFGENGIEYLQQQLASLDPSYFNIVDRANPQRLIRALEVSLSAGMPYSAFRRGGKQARPFKVINIGLNRDRDELYRRINHRVDLMMQAGLLEEVRSLMPFEHLNALKTVGYTELFDYLHGNISLADAVEEIKRNTRRYAKRQLTWFRREEDMSWFRPEEELNIIKLIESRSSL